MFYNRLFFYLLGNCIKTDLAVFLSLGKIGEICQRLLAAFLVDIYAVCFIKPVKDIFLAVCKIFAGTGIVEPIERLH